MASAQLVKGKGEEQATAVECYSLKQANPVLDSVEEGYKFYSNASLSSPSGTHYLVISKSGGVVQIQDDPSHDSKGPYYIMVSYSGQLAKYNNGTAIAYEGARLPQNDSYELIVNDKGEAWISLDGTPKQQLNMPW